MPSNPARGVPQIYPRLAYRDPTETVVWLERAFGLKERRRARLDREDGGIQLTELELGTGLVMIGTAGVQAGARIVMELRDQPWGDRRYEALDLEGHRWYFAEHVRDVPPEEWKRAAPG